MESDAEKRLTGDGEAFLRDTGIKEGQFVLDFGYREG
jgi:hypothetical protein